MPLIRFDLGEGRTVQEITNLLDAAHRALVSAFGIPLIRPTETFGFVVETFKACQT